MPAARAGPIQEAFKQKHQVNTFFQHDQRRPQTHSQALRTGGTPGQSSIRAGQLPSLPPAALLASGPCSGDRDGEGGSALTCECLCLGLSVGHGGHKEAGKVTSGVREYARSPGLELGTPRWVPELVVWGQCRSTAGQRRGPGTGQRSGHVADRGTCHHQPCLG